MRLYRAAPIIAIAACSLSFYAGLSVRQPPTERVEYQTVYIPITPLPVKESHYRNEQINRIAATISASDLREASR